VNLVKFLYFVQIILKLNRSIKLLINFLIKNIKKLENLLINIKTKNKNKMNFVNQIKVMMKD
jgi:hypothetical protein